MLMPIDKLPDGYNSVNPFVIVKGGATDFISFVEETFGAQERRSVRTPDKDGTLIHAEIAIGNATLMLADSKDDWPFTPAFIQIYVVDAQKVLDRAIARGAELVTQVSNFYGGFKLARFKDPFENIWWLYEPDPEGAAQQGSGAENSDWHAKKPSVVYLTIMKAMRELDEPPRPSFPEERQEPLR